MSRRSAVKPNHRFVLCIPDSLRIEIENRVSKMGITFAEFGREAFELYVNETRNEERDAQLAETCRQFERKNNGVLKEWAGVEAETWPA